MAFPRLRGDWAAPALTALIAAALWVALGAVDADAMARPSALGAGLHLAALVSTALSAILVLERLVLTVLFPPSLGRQATGVQRAVTFALLGFVIVSLTLTHLGIDPRTVWATAAVATAAIGFALQPTLSSIIAGLNLHLEARLRVGDRIEHDGAPLTITEMNWRSITGRRGDGSLIGITNARLAENPIIIHRADEATQLQASIPAPIGMAPAQVRALVVDVLLDLPAIDITAALSVAPVELQSSPSLAIYQVNATLKPKARLAAARGELFSRLWYTYQRHHITLPSAAGLSHPWHDDRAETWATPEVLERLLPYLLDHMAERPMPERLAPGCELLMYGPGERLTAPERTEGRRFLVLAGRAVAGLAFGPAPALDDDDSFNAVQRRRIAVAALGGELSALIGPYGEYAVWSLARETADLADLRRRAAEEIVSEDQRAVFLRGTGGEASSVLTPGEVLTAERDAFGALICGRNLRAVSEVLLLAIAPDAAPPKAKAAGRKATSA